MSTIKKLMLTAASGAEALAIEDVFSTYLYTGNSSTQTITNGIDLAGEGGLVWIKNRSAAANHFLFDTERGATNYVLSNSTIAQTTNSTTLTSFSSDSFSLGASSFVNSSGLNFASWTFRKAPRFFDVVTYTGDGASSRTISHSLDCEPGTVIIKRTDSTSNWAVWHRSLTQSGGTGGGAYNLSLNGTNAEFSTSYINSASSADFTVGGGVGFFNNNGATFVAYLFAHDPLGPSGDGSDGLIACGSYTGNGSTNGPEINLGWEPQWVMIKRTDVGGAGYDWFMFDAMRGMPVGGADLYVDANSSDAETGSSERFQITPTGFKLATTSGSFNASGGTYIYIAIRRGPMRQPESGTEVFAIDTRSSGQPSYTSGFPVDMVVYSDTTGTNHATSSRLQGNVVAMYTNLTNAEAGYDADWQWDVMDGFGREATDRSQAYLHMFRRAPGFFDVVAYTGTGVARTVHHNLGVAPEMIWVKGRSYAEGWPVYHTGTGNTDYTRINTTGATVPSSAYWNNTTPTETEFTVGTVDRVNFSGATYIAYLFATLPGVSKVGSYTGNGTSQTINCGFTSGARFILIKRTDSSGDWYFWDTTRGIVTGNDPHLSLNTTAAEVTTDDSIDPASTGFIVNQVAATNINVSSASYIFYAIA